MGSRERAGDCTKGREKQEKEGKNKRIYMVHHTCDGIYLNDSHYTITCGFLLVLPG